MLGNSSLLSLGFSGGIVNNQIDASKLVFDNWDNNSQSFYTYNGNHINTNTSYFDLNIGLNYAFFVSNSAYYNIGISAMHINKPTESFIVSPNSGNQKLPIRTNLFLNANYKIEDLWILNPNLYFSNSANRNEILIGINANRNLSGDGIKQLIAGLYFRTNDALIPMIGYQLNDTKVTISYDVTTSALGTFNNGLGGYELSIIKNSSYKKDHPIKCPSMKF
jgi:type IX secretion system PorP/SprF family membrane protein